MKYSRSVLMIISFALVMVSCASLPPTLVTSTSPLPGGVRGTIPTYGSDCQFYFLGLVPVSGTLNTQSALEAAKEKIDVDVLTDVTVDYGGAYFILFSNNCVRIRGMGVPKNVIASLSHAPASTKPTLSPSLVPEPAPPSRHGLKERPL